MRVGENGLLLRDFLEAKHGKTNPDTLVHFVECPHCHLSTWWVEGVLNRCDRCCTNIIEDWTRLGSGYITTTSLFWENKTEPFKICEKEV